MNFEQISKIERERIANWKKSLEDIYVLGKRYSKNIFEYQTSINLLKASVQMAITPCGFETLQLKTIPLFLRYLFLELIFMMESILLIIARVIMIPLRFLLSFNILNLMLDLFFIPMLFIAAFLHTTLNLAIHLISVITRPFATIFYLFSSSTTENSFQARLHAIQDYINQSSLTMPEKHNALHILECLIWLNTKKGQQQVIQNLYDQTLLPQ